MKKSIIKPLLMLLVSVSFMPIQATILRVVPGQAAPDFGPAATIVRFDVPVHFYPAAYVTLIWAVIGISYLVFGIYQFLPANRYEPLIERIRFPLVIAALGNITWTVLFVRELLSLHGQRWL